MKKFNQLTEKQMDGVRGGSIGALLLNILALIIAPLAVGGSVGYGAYEGTKNNK